MKILFVIDSFFTGGAEFSTLEIVRYLKENGIQISVCKLKNKEPQYDASLFGLDISDVFTLPTGGFWTKRKALQKSIQEFKPDIIHCFSIGAPITPHFMEFAKTKGMPLLLNIFLISSTLFSDNSSFK